MDKLSGSYYLDETAPLAGWGRVLAPSTSAIWLRVAELAGVALLVIGVTYYL